MVSGACADARLDLPQPVLLPANAAFEDVHVADELGDEARARLFVDLARRRHLHDAAVIHHGDAVRHGHRLFLIVRDDHEGHAERVLDIHQLELRFLAQLLVEGAERLVEQQELGTLGERPRQRHALALAAGELARIALRKTLELHEPQHLVHARGDLGLRQARPAAGRSRYSARRSCAGTARRTGTSC